MLLKITYIVANSDSNVSPKFYLRSYFKFSLKIPAIKKCLSIDIENISPKLLTDVFWETSIQCVFTFTGKIFTLTPVCLMPLLTSGITFITQRKDKLKVCRFQWTFRAHVLKTPTFVGVREGTDVMISTARRPRFFKFIRTISKFTSEFLTSVS